MATFQLPQLHGSAVKFSPLQSDLLAVACSQFYGQGGPGALFILETDQRFPYLLEYRSFKWAEGLLNVTWSKNVPDTLLTSSVDGSLQLWNMRAAENENCNANPPLQVFKEHQAEVYSIDWTTVNENPQLLSGSWDQTIKLWDPNRIKSLLTYNDDSINKQNLIFSVSFSGGQRNVFCSAGSDGFLKVWSMNEPVPVGSVQTSVGVEAMSCDWNKIDENLIVVGDSGGAICVYDVRCLAMPYSRMNIKEDVALKNVAFSSKVREHIASVGYDGITR